MDTRDKIIDSAIGLFAVPDNKVSMVDVAAAVGVSGPALYRYFRNKDELYRAALEMDIDRLLFDTLHTVKDVPSPFFTAQIWGALLAEMPHHPLAVRAVVSREPDALALLRDCVGGQLFLTALSHEVQSAHSAGIFRQDIDPIELAASASLMMHSISIPMAFEGKFKTPEWDMVHNTILAAGIHPVPDWTDEASVMVFVNQVLALGPSPVIAQHFNKTGG